MSKFRPRNTVIACRVKPHNNELDHRITTFLKIGDTPLSTVRYFLYITQFINYYQECSTTVLKVAGSSQNLWKHSLIRCGGEGDGMGSAFK